MNSIIVIVLMFFSTFSGQESKEKESKKEIVVTATRTETEQKDAPYTTDVINQHEIERTQPRLTPDTLKHTTSVSLQKTAYGQGSPFIRGWTAYHNLFLIDGIRLNNSAFRSGPNQYWATVDPYLIQRIEVVKGPVSSLYGSDAIGGTVNAITRSPFDVSDKKGFYPELKLRHATAEDSTIGRAQVTQIFSRQLGLTGGLSLKDFNDFTGGRTQGLFEETGFEERDGDIKLVYIPGNIRFTAAYQRSFQDNVPRTHKTILAKKFNGTSIGKELQRDLDQFRELTYLKIESEKAGILGDDAMLTLSLHSQDELRTRVKNSGEFDHQGFDVNSFGTTLQFSRDTKFGKFTYGSDFYRDYVDSFKRKFSSNGSLKSHGIQGPIADNTTYNIFGAFIQNEYRFTKDFRTITGIRYNRIAANLNSIDVNGNPEELEDNWNAIVGSLRGIYDLNKQISLYGGVSEGFRTPTIADLSKLDDTSAVEKPSPGLDPENFITSEIGIRTNSERFSGYMAYWYTLIDNLIVQSPTGEFENGVQVVSKDNIGDGYVNGVELEAGYKLIERLKLSSRFTHMFGQVDQLDEAQGFTTTREPLSRLMPTTLELQSDYFLSEKITVVGIGRFVDKQDRLALRDKNDTSRIPPDGTPGYAAFDLGIYYYPTSSIDISLSIENIFDKDYRVHGSGVNEPGTNVILATNIRF